MKSALSNWRSVLRSPTLLLAFGLGSGCLRPASGTWGTLLGLIFLAPFFPYSSPLFSAIFIVLAFSLGVFLCDRASKILGVHDFSGIVFDEWVGVWLILFFYPPALYQRFGQYLSLVIIFLLFRLFDILKPPPIRQVDRKVSGGLGIMLDDLLAGALALALLYLFVYIGIL